MNLSHYHSVPFELDHEYKYHQSTGPKPSGLWVSVDGEYDWREWCTVEGFNTEDLAVQHRVILKPDANIWHLTEPEQLRRVPTRDMHHVRWDVPWPRIAEDFQGIIISPYQWSVRMELLWYYGWDCASGCIWDLSAIEKMEVMDEARNL